MEQEPEEQAERGLDIQAGARSRRTPRVVSGSLVHILREMGLHGVVTGPDIWFLLETRHVPYKEQR